jgi:hypothetical protein
MDAAKLAFGFKKSERAMVAFCHGEILIAVIPPILLACAEEWCGGCVHGRLMFSISAGADDFSTDELKQPTILRFRVSQSISL